MLLDRFYITVDTRTIAVLIAVGALCLAFLQGLMARRHQGHVIDAMRMCAYSFTATATGNLLSVFRNVIPDFFARSVASTLILIGVVGCYWTVKKLKREKIPARYCLTVIALNFVLFSWFLFIAPNLSARLIVLNLCMIAVLAPLCFTLLFKVEPRRRATWWLAGGLFSLMLFVLVIRTAYLAANYTVYMPLTDGMMLPALILKSSQLMILVAGVVFILMASGEITEELSRIALCDPLTSIYNRRGFHEHAGRSWNSTDGSGVTNSLLLLDLDHFKSINDKYGHAMGDMVLKRVAAAISSQLRSEDILGRYGGEEFIVLLPGTTSEQALQVAERLRQVVESLPVELDDYSNYLTVSIGLASGGSESKDLERLFSESDHALYLAKSSGRNRVAMAGVSEVSYDDRCKSTPESLRGSREASSIG